MKFNPPSNMITQLETKVRGKDGIDYRIRIMKDQPDHSIHLAIDAELYIAKDFLPVGPTKNFSIESLMKSDIEDWRKQDAEFSKIEKASKEKPPSDWSTLIDPWSIPAPTPIVQMVVEKHAAKVAKKSLSKALSKKTAKKIAKKKKPTKKVAKKTKKKKSKVKK